MNLPRLVPLLAVLAAVTLAGCSTAPAAPAPGPSSSFPVTEVVDEDAFKLLTATTGGDSVEAYELVGSVCGSPFTPTEQAAILDEGFPPPPDRPEANTLTVRFAVLAGCPDKADWSPSPSP